MLQVSLDGGITYQDVKEEVRIIYPGLMPDDESVDLHIVLTNEGIVMDLWAADEDELQLRGTDSETLEEISERLVH
jgi:hypothetical protein